MAYSGKNGRCVLNGHNLDGTKWTILERAEEVNLSCFELPRTSTWFPASRDADITLEGLWTEHIHKNPPNLKAGDVVELKILPDYVNAPQYEWAFPSVYLCSVEVDAEVRGVIKYTIIAKSQSYLWKRPFNYATLY